jgi:hypothetical protein
MGPLRIGETGPRAFLRGDEGRPENSNFARTGCGSRGEYTGPHDPIVAGSVSFFRG